jgi:hypothetical protein
VGPRTRGALLAVLLVAFGAGVVVAGQRDGPPPPLPGVERLGPEPGEPVAGYLNRAARSLPAPGAGDAWALVQLDRHVAADVAARLVQRVRLARVVLRVPLPRVQTALTTRSIPGQQPAAEIEAALRAAARERAAAAAAAPDDGRAAAVAAAEAQRLRAGCDCVVAMLVRADHAALAGLARRDGVRAVHAAQPGTPPQGLALAPLLPQQRRVAGPVPDDGPVP